MKHRIAVLLAATALGTAGCSMPDSSPTPDAVSEAAAQAQAGAPAAGEPAAAVLARLAVKGRAPDTCYDRDQFGQYWAVVEHNGCDSRNDFLARVLVD